MKVTKQELLRDWESLRDRLKENYDPVWFEVDISDDVGRQLVRLETSSCFLVRMLYMAILDDLAPIIRQGGEHAQSLAPVAERIETEQPNLWRQPLSLWQSHAWFSSLNSGVLDASAIGRCRRLHRNGLTDEEVYERMWNKRQPTSALFTRFLAHDFLYALLAGETDFVLANFERLYKTPVAKLEQRPTMSMMKLCVALAAWSEGDEKALSLAEKHARNLRRQIVVEEVASSAEVPYEIWLPLALCFQRFLGGTSNPMEFIYSLRPHALPD